MTDVTKMTGFIFQTINAIGVRSFPKLVKMFLSKMSVTLEFGNEGSFISFSSKMKLTSDY